MNRDRVRAELPADVAAALDALTAWDPTVGAETWDQVARTLVRRLSAQLLQDDTLGWDRYRRAHYVTASEAVRAILPRLPVKQWGALTVVTALLAYFEIAGGESTLCLALRTQAE